MKRRSVAGAIGLAVLASLAPLPAHAQQWDISVSSSFLDRLNALQYMGLRQQAATSAVAESSEGESETSCTSRDSASVYDINICRYANFDNPEGGALDAVGPFNAYFYDDYLYWSVAGDLLSTYITQVGAQAFMTQPDTTSDGNMSASMGGALMALMHTGALIAGTTAGGFDNAGVTLAAYPFKNLLDGTDTQPFKPTAVLCMGTLDEEEAGEGEGETDLGGLAILAAGNSEHSGQAAYFTAQSSHGSTTTAMATPVSSIRIEASGNVTVQLGASE